MQPTRRDNTGASAGHALRDRLLHRGWEVDFFQAVWLLERHLVNGVAVGDRGPVADESLRFRPDVELGFPPTDVRRITQCERSDGGSPYFQIDVTFMGLYGVATPLPLHYAVDILRSTERSTSAEAETDPAPGRPEQPGTSTQPSDTTPVRSFLDLFHHRLISMFYRSWTKYRYDVSFGIPNRDVITPYLLWLIGCSPGDDADLLGLPPLRLLRYAGMWTAHPKSAVSLEGLLSDYWVDIPIEVRQFSGRWVPLASTDMNQMGVGNSRLGVDLTVGEQVYDLSGAFTIAVGPVDWETYRTFLPDGDRFNATRRLTQYYGDDPLSFDIDVTLRGGEAPETSLSSDDGAGRLGFTSWVRTEDVPETIVTFDAPVLPPTRATAEAQTNGGPTQGSGLGGLGRTDTTSNAEHNRTERMN